MVVKEILIQLKTQSNIQPFITLGLQIPNLTNYYPYQYYEQKLLISQKLLVVLILDYEDSQRWRKLEKSPNHYHQGTY